MIQRGKMFIFATFQFIKRPDNYKKFSGLNSFVKIPTEIAMLEVPLCLGYEMTNVKLQASPFFS